MVCIKLIKDAFFFTAKDKTNLKRLIKKIQISKTHKKLLNYRKRAWFAS